MLPPIATYLKASAAVTAILGSNPIKAYRHGEAPQGKTPPYVVWSVINDTPENNLSGPPPTDRTTIQIDCYQAGSTGDADIVTLAQAVRDALEPHGHMTGMPINQREKETRFFRIALQFDFFVDR